MSSPTQKRRRTLRLSALGAALGLAAAGSVVGFADAPAAVAQVAGEAAVAPQAQGEVMVETLTIDLEPISIAPDTAAAQASQTLTQLGLAADPGDATMVVIRDEIGDLALSVRSKNDGVWSDWVEVAAAADEAPDGLPNEEGSSAPPVAIGPIWIGDASDIEVVQTSGRATSLTIDLLTDEVEVLPHVSPGALTNAAKPAIQPRSAWATADHSWRSNNADCDGGPFYADNVKAVIVHHTVTTNSYSQADSPSLIRGIYHTHAVANGWCDIAYNFVVDKFGTIWQGRSGDMARPVIGGHARGFNTNTVGVALLGQHHPGASPAAASPSGASIGAVEALAAWKLGLHGGDPNGTTWLKNRATEGIMRFSAGQWVQLPTIVGHRDVGLTSCPGNHAHPSVIAMRPGVAAGRVGSGPYEFPALTPSDHGPALLTVERAGGIRPAFAADNPASPPTSLPAGRTAVAIGGTATRGYILLDDGSLRSYGGAPTVAGSPGGSGADDLVVRSDGASGWILNGTQIIGFGGQSSTSVSSSAVGFDLSDARNGYAVTAAGQLLPVGSAPARSLGGSGSIVDVTVQDTGTSGWALTSNGQLRPFGGTSVDSVSVAAGAARAVAASPTNLGGWVLDSEGRLLPFGDERPALPISTTVGSPVAVDLAIVDYVSGDDVRATDDGAYIDALAETFYGRPATDVELDVWVSQLDYYSRDWLTTRLSTSNEYAGTFVEDTYQTALGRAAEPAGKQYWLDQLQAGLPSEALGIYFYGSNEFVIKNGGNSGFVTELYNVLLHRTPDAGGHAYWLDLLESGRAGPDAVAAGFYASIESRRDRVTRLYQQFLGRTPERSGLDFWADRLQQIGDFALAAELAQTDEFYNRASDS